MYGTNCLLLVNVNNNERNNLPVSTRRVRGGKLTIRPNTYPSLYGLTLLLERVIHK